MVVVEEVDEGEVEGGALEVGDADAEGLGVVFEDGEEEELFERGRGVLADGGKMG